MAHDVNSISFNSNDKQLVRWFALLVLIGPIHVGEQLMFGLDTLYELQAILGGYYSFFTNPDVGTVLLVIITVTLVQSFLLAVLAGGRWRLLVAGFFGIAGVGEAHHIVQTVVQGKYFPGLVTSFAYVWIGVMVLRAVVREWPVSRQQAQKHLTAA